MGDFVFALKKSLLEEYKNCKGKPDEKTEKEINNLAEAIIKKEAFERLKKASLKYFSSPPLALIGFDVDRIKDYVFASSHPKEIRGASAIIEEFTDKQLKDWIKDFIDERHIIFAGGGSGIILAPRYQAEEIKKKIESEFQKLTLSGTCTVEYEEFFPYELVYGKRTGEIIYKATESKIKSYLDIGYITSLSDKEHIPFGKIAEILGAKIRRVKNSKIREEFYSLLGILRRCTSCGVRPASQVDREHHDYRAAQPWKTAICESCAYKRKREIGDKKKKDEFAARSFQDLVKNYSKKYISVIYLDVNKMGEARENLKTPEEYKKVSEIIGDAFKEAVAYVKKELSGKYQSLVMGGDDLILILPAEEASKMVERLIDFIDQKFKNPQGNVPKGLKEKLQNLTLATGFVIAPSHFPIKFLVNYAFDLLKEAKRLSYKENKSAVDFLILKDSSPLNVSIEEYIKTNYETPEICYTSRPYPFDDFKKNIEVISKIKSIPKTQLNIIKELLLKESPRTALLNIRYQTVKMIDLWRNVLGNNIIEWSDFFLQRKDGRYVTKFIDLLELMEFGGQDET
jgi:CRISPR-associated protein Cmr2